MILQRASFTHFRNYESVCVDLSPCLNIFVGDNGHGKSSFLEGIYCALRGRSFHPFVGSQFIQKGHQNAKLFLSFKEKEGSSELVTDFFIQNERLKKRQNYCGKNVSRFFLEERFPIFVFTEDSLKCIRQGPSERRAFIESFFSCVEDIKNKENFYKILLQKRQLLKNYKKSIIQKQDFFNLLPAINEQFLKASYELVKSRLNSLKSLYSSLPVLSSVLFGGDRKKLRFLYHLKEDQIFEESTDLLAFLEEDLKKQLSNEIESGMALSGPHKHEISFLFNGEDSRTFCSKGQQRTYLLTLILSQLKILPQAFLLLDDALLELDEGVQKNFLDFIEKNHCQTFLTSCNILSFKMEKTHTFYVRNGQITK